MSQQINLFNPVFLKKKKYFSARAMLQALGALFVGLLGLYALEARDVSTLEASVAAAEVRLKERRAQFTKLAGEVSPQGRSKLLEEELARTEQLLAARQKLLKSVTTDVSANQDGYAAHLTALARQVRPGLWLTGLSIDGRDQVTLRGRALDADLVPGYLQALSREDIMRGRRVAELKLAAKGEPAAAPAAPAAAAALRVPERYVEFAVVLPARGAEPVAQSAPGLGGKVKP